MCTFVASRKLARLLRIPSNDKGIYRDADQNNRHLFDADHSQEELLRWENLPPKAVRMDALICKVQGHPKPERKGMRQRSQQAQSKAASAEVDKPSDYPQSLHPREQPPQFCVINAWQPRLHGSVQSTALGHWSGCPAVS
jgi:hypothetical protein